MRELAAQPEFEHVVVNDRLEQATAELVGIVHDALAASTGERAANLVGPEETDST